MEITPEAVRRFRFRRHRLDAEAGSLARAADLPLLDLGVQDTGPDGSGWALALRGARPEVASEVALAWTLRGAPHAYRAADLDRVGVATAPFSEADARKRVFDASRPLKAAGIDVLDALRTIAGHLRDLVVEPRVKGEVSAALTERLDEPYLRRCRPCGAVHAYENPFRLAALQGGLVLQPGTSPPVLERAPGLAPNRYERLGSAAEERWDVVRGHLRFFGPARVRDVAEALDAPVREVRAHWPADAVPVAVAGTDGSARDPYCVLEADAAELGTIGPAGGAVRMLGPYDPYVQLRDRAVLVDDEARRKALWPVLGRPGAVVRDGDVVGTWRPRTRKGSLALAVDPWVAWPAALRRAVEAEAERLAAFRGVDPGGLVEE